MLGVFRERELCMRGLCVREVEEEAARSSPQACYYSPRRARLAAHIAAQSERPAINRKAIEGDVNP